MGRSVLGNDPFKRGAAARPPEEEATRGTASKGETKPPAEPSKNAARRGETNPAAAPSSAKGRRPRSGTSTKSGEAANAPLASEKQADAAKGAGLRSAKTTEKRSAVQSAPPAARAATTTATTTATKSAEQRGAPYSLQAPGFADRAATALALGRNVVAQAASSQALSDFKVTASGILHAVQTALGTSGAVSVDDYGKDVGLVKELGALGTFLYDSYWRVQVEGAQKLPAGAAILVANHSGAVPFDGPVLHAALRRERADLGDARWLIEDQLFYAPFLGTLLNRLGAVRASPENALRLLSDFRPVIVFPEGIQGISKPFSERYKLMRFGRGGFVKLALRARVPIVPIAIVGGEESSPLLARIPAKPLGMPYVPITSPVPLPARWTIRVGEPLRIDEHAPEAADDLLLVNRLNDRTRESIQGMLQSMLKARTSVFA